MKKTNQFHWIWIFLGAFLIYYFVSHRKGRPAAAVSVTNAPVAAQVGSGAAQTAAATPATPITANAPAPKATRTPESPRTQIDAISEAAKHQFLSTSKLQVSLPNDLFYGALDPDDPNMTAIYGVNSRTKVGMTMLARRGNATPEDAMAYFKDGSSFFPNTKGQNVSLSAKPSQTLQGPAGSGIGNITMWNGTEKNGNEVNVLFIQRTDKAGMYMAVYTGPSAYFQNDNRFQDILKTAKALPAK